MIFTFLDKFDAFTYLDVVRSVPMNRFIRNLLNYLTDGLLVEIKFLKYTHISYHLGFMYFLWFFHLFFFFDFFLRLFLLWTSPKLELTFNLIPFVLQPLSDLLLCQILPDLQHVSDIRIILLHLYNILYFVGNYVNAKAVSGKFFDGG